MAASIVITALHYADNYLFLHEYPGPDWVHHETIYIAWSLLTLVGVAGYLLYKEGRSVAAGLYLLVYSFTGLSSLGHYLHGGLDEFSPKMHLFVWTDALAGALVLLCAIAVLRGSRTQGAVTDR